METIDIINEILKVSFINILTYFVFIKLVNYKNNNNIKTCIIIGGSIIEACIEYLLMKHVPILPKIIIMYYIYGCLIANVTKNKTQYSIMLTFISLTITYLIYLISIILAGILVKTLNLNISKNHILILFITVLIETIILYAIFKIKRIRNGIAFLQDPEKVNNVGIIGMIFIGIVLIIYSIIQDTIHTRYIFWGMVIEFICVCIWVNKKITTYYKQKLKERTIEELESEIKERDEEINKILEENKEIATINHKYSNRIKSLENFSHQIMSKPELVEKMETEFGEDFINFEKQINNISEEYTKEIEDSIQHKNHLEKTGIFGIDNILEYMSNEAIKNNIKFNLKIYEDIQYMIENIIDQSKLETLLGDHIKDAIIAINSSENTYKELLVEIGEIENCYQVCIYDTGIEFEIDTLLNLGLKAITTHKLTGGSGIGFMTTFETLKATKASLIIEERHPIDDKDYTKAVRIKFDGKHEYRICSYRSKEIQNKNKDTRIIIE